MKSPAQAATELVNNWLADTAGMPITLQVARLGIMVAGAVQTGMEDMRKRAALTAERRSLGNQSGK